MIWLAFLFEWWVQPVDGHQHRFAFEAGTRVSVVTAWLGATWWGRPDALSPHNPLNLEANGWMERGYGVRVQIPLGSCSVGAEYSRRGIEEFGVPRSWGTSIGYHDGLRGVASCAGVSLRTPYLWRPNDPLTLPWHDWTLEAAGGTGRLLGTGTVAFAGPQPGPAWDVGLLVRVLAYGRDLAIWLGFNVGAVDRPGPGAPLRRVAVTLWVR